MIRLDQSAIQAWRLVKESLEDAQNHWFSKATFCNAA